MKIQIPQTVSRQFWAFARKCKVIFVRKREDVSILEICDFSTKFQVRPWKPPKTGATR